MDVRQKACLPQAAHQFWASAESRGPAQGSQSDRQGSTEQDTLYCHVNGIFDHIDNEMELVKHVYRWEYYLGVSSCSG